MEFVFYYSLALLTNLLLIVAIIKKRFRTRSADTFILVLSLLSLWALTDVYSSLLGPSNTALKFRLDVIAGSFGYIPLAPAFLVFTLFFTKHAKILKQRSFWVLLIVPTAFFILLATATELVIITDIAKASLYPWGYTAPSPPLFPLFLAWFETHFVISLILLIRYRRLLSDKIEKKQTALFIIGVLIPLVIGTITDGILPILGITVYPAAVALTTALALVVGYAIIKYGLFDINMLSIAENILDSVPDSILVVSTEGKIQYLNPPVTKVTGYEARELLGFSAHKLIDEKILETIQQRPLSNFQIELSAKNKKKIPVNITSNLVVENGEHLGTVVSLTDLRMLSTINAELEEKIAELDKANADLGDSQKAVLNLLEDVEREKTFAEEVSIKDQAILSNIGEGLLVLDTSGRIILTNPVVEQMTGVKSERLIGKLASEIIKIFGDDDQPLPENAGAFQNVKDPWKTETLRAVGYIQRPDKSKVPVVSVISSVIVGGKVVGAAQILTDITREKELELAQLEFISLASHQLNTPLSAIKWFSEMLADGDAGELNKEQKNFTQKIVISTRRMIDLVNTLLDISRIESGRIAVVPEPASLLKLVDETIIELTPRIKAKKLKVTVKSTPDLPKVVIDPQLVREIYSNFLTNAIKYSPAGTKITVSLFVDKAKGEIVSKVSDQGYGIPKNQQKLVFTRFFRADNIIRIDTEGTGLGLYLAKSIVEASGGRIGFVSTEKKGSTFWFTIPLKGMKPKEGQVSLHGGGP